MPIKDIDQLTGHGTVANNDRIAIWPTAVSIPERGTVAELQDNLEVWLGTLMHPGYRANRWYATAQPTREIGTAVPAANQLYLYPFRLWRRMTIAQFGVRIIAGGAGSAVKIGIYDSTTGRPQGSPLLVNNTGAATTGTGEVNLAVTATLLEMGTYWIGQIYDGTPPTAYSISNLALTFEQMIGRDSLGSNVGVSALSLAETYAGNLPAIGSGDTLNDVTALGVPHVWLRSAP